MAADADPTLPAAPDFARNLSWDDLRAFLAVSVHGSMNRAAQALGESQPTVGRRMRRLEERTGLVLMERSANHVAITEAGHALLRVLLPMGQASGEIAHVLQALSPREDEPIRLTATTSVALFLSEAMAELHRAAAPRQLVLVPTRQSLDPHRGETDLALRMRRVSSETGLLSRRVALISFAIYGRAGATDLPMILPSGHHNMSAHRRVALAQIPPRRQGPQIDELHLRLQAVRAGVGAGILPCWMGDAEPGLECLSRETAQFIHEEIFLVRSERSRGDRAIEAVAKALVTLLRRSGNRLDRRGEMGGEIDAS